MKSRSGLHRIQLECLSVMGGGDVLRLIGRVLRGIISLLKATVRKLLEADNAWLFVFLPALVCYISILNRKLNFKREVGHGVEFLFPEMEDFIRREDAKIEVVTEGLSRPEGPLWVYDEDGERSFLLFSDVRENRMWKWEEGFGFFTIGRSLFQEQSGCSGDDQRCTELEEPGSNGMAQMLDSKAYLVCEHGNRRVVRLETNGTKAAVATHYEGRPLNSPNDLAQNSYGDVYFTDLATSQGTEKDGPKLANAVYMVRREVLETVGSGSSGSSRPHNDLEERQEAVERLDIDVPYPNGLAFSPDFKRMYVSNSDKDNGFWNVYDVAQDGRLVNGRLFADAQPLIREDREGLPDGIKVDEKGNVVCAGPGGVVVFDKDGRHLGTIRTGVVAGNLAFGGDGYLYISAAQSILRIKVLTKEAKAKGVKKRPPVKKG